MAQLAEQLTCNQQVFGWHLLNAVGMAGVYENGMCGERCVSASAASALFCLYLVFSDWFLL